MYGALFGGGAPPSTGYDNPSVLNVAYRLQIALDRDDRLNKEESLAKFEAEMENEFGPRWFMRAHP